MTHLGWPQAQAAPQSADTIDCNPTFKSLKNHPVICPNLSVDGFEASYLPNQIDHGRGPWSRLKEMDAPGRCMNWALAQVYATSYSFCLESLQYHRENKTANVIVCLFAYFVQSVCQMQIEPTRHLYHAPLLLWLPLRPPFSLWSSVNTPSQINRSNKTTAIGWFWWMCVYGLN